MLQFGSMLPTSIACYNMVQCYLHLLHVTIWFNVTYMYCMLQYGSMLPTFIVCYNMCQCYLHLLHVTMMFHITIDTSQQTYFMYGICLEVHLHYDNQFQNGIMTLISQ